MTEDDCKLYEQITSKLVSQYSEQIQFLSKLWPQHRHLLSAFSWVGLQGQVQLFFSSSLPSTSLEISPYFCKSINHLFINLLFTILIFFLCRMALRLRWSAPAENLINPFIHLQAFSFLLNSTSTKQLILFYIHIIVQTNQHILTNRICSAAHPFTSRIRNQKKKK